MALEWFSVMCSHVPNKGEQMVRYYGYYSNAARGKRKKPAPHANALPIDVIPLYDKPPVTDADDYLTDPDYPTGVYFLRKIHPGCTGDM